ncbi:MAG: hypothetical protein ABIR78_13080 [Ferruginibacter sp.]
MTSTTRSNGIMSFPGSLILKAGLLSGTLDILSACLYSYIKKGTAPTLILQSISKVALGKTTYTNPTVLAITGLLVHFAIAFSWTVIFFFLYSRAKLMRQNRMLTAIIYGIFVWAMMSMVILPLWNNKPFVFKAENASISAMILVIAIGLPLSFIAHNHYSKKNTGTL